MNRPMIYIVAEGKDSFFLEDFISRHYPKKNKDIDYTCTYSGGYTSLNTIRQKLSQNTFVGGVNILIFDADTTGIANGGVTDRTKFLHERARMDNVVIDDIFLFPDNQNDGEYEDLLEIIVSETHQQVISEYQKFEKSLLSLRFPYTSNPPSYSQYQTPDKKTMIYTYSHVLKYSYKDLLDKKQVSKNSKDLETGPYHCFKDTDFWNLHHSALDPLKKFLDKYLL